MVAVGEQLRLDFSASVSRRTRRAALEQLAAAPELFPHVPNIDVSLAGPKLALATFAGTDPPRTQLWFEQLVGPTESIAARRVLFPTAKLHKLLFVRPPAVVSLDAAVLAVARAQWAQALGYKPLRVSRHRSRLLASSLAWPKSLAVSDAPWPVITCLLATGVPFDVDPDARVLLVERAEAENIAIAQAGLAGSAVLLRTARPDLLEALGLPALAHVPGEPGRYKMPLLAARCLLDEASVELSDELTAAIRRCTATPRTGLTLPEDFPWTLFEFQAKDAAKALRILEVCGGVLLAGEMGSGKTTVSLAIAEHLKTWPLLVVAPLAAFSTWARQLGEMRKNYFVANGPPEQVWETLSTQSFDAVVISYDRLHAFVELIETLPFRAVIADELQRIRTPSSRRSRAMRRLAAHFPIRIGLSGTPLQNRLADLLAPGAFLVPGEWRARANSRDLEDVYVADPVQSVAEHLGCLMVRRRIEDTGVTLPGKTVRRVYVDLTPEQRRALSDVETEAQHAAEAGELSSKVHVFARLAKLRQIVSCPQMANVAGPNPKLTAALDLVEEFLEMGRKGIVFCTHRQTWLQLHEQLAERNIGSTGIWGSSSVAERLEAERRFHADPTIKVFVGTLASCAESLTLSPTATFCVFVDLSYSPADLAQAEARMYRMNTKEPVEVVYLHAKSPTGTIDDRIVELLNHKRALFARVVDNDANWSDETQVHYSMGDLVYLLTGRHDEAIESREADQKAALAAEQAQKAHARATAHRHKTKEFLDDGSHALTRAEHDALLAAKLLPEVAESIDDESLLDAEDESVLADVAHVLDEE